jgi:tRNA dimethylallyltransferase
MQIYKEISILTSKPNSQDTKIIKHHLYGFNSVKKKFSTGLWLEMVIKKIEEQWNNEKIPIVVGGTGLYFKALTDGLVKIPDIPNNMRTQIRKLHKKIGQKKFFIKLIKLDPLAKRFVLSSDTQRSMRAYEVKKFTNKSLFEFTKKTKSNFNNNVFKKLFINIPRELLHKKIEKRVEKMFNEGAVDEVKKFCKMKVNKELSSNKIIGIKEIKDYLRGKITLIKAKELIMQKTRQYAKRQFTWARGHMKSWEMFYSPNINDLFKKTINKIS